MPNSLNIDLEGKVVIFKRKYLKVEPLDHPFKVTGGFGAKPDTLGNALFGQFLSDGEDARMEGYMVERLATEEEIARFENRGGQVNCDRCGHVATAFTGSYFNTDTICLPCRDLEEAHPQFEQARQAEMEAVERGDYNFHGIGLPADLRPS